MSAKVQWVVSRGSYSDYRVLCACPSKKAAKAIAAAVNTATGDESGDYYSAFVESLPIIERAEMVTVYGLVAEVFDNGTTAETKEIVREECNADMLYPHYFRPAHKRWIRAPYLQGRPIKGGRLEVFGTDLERVRRVFSDTRAQLIADPALRARKEFAHGA